MTNTNQTNDSLNMTFNQRYLLTQMLAREMNSLEQIEATLPPNDHKRVEQANVVRFLTGLLMPRSGAV